MPAEVASTETSMLETVLQYGTGRAAALGQFAAGKTGTTSNYGDAWFVGFDSKYTVAVWVGYPDKLIPMTTEFNGSPVLGGTFPALIWHQFMVSSLAIDKARAEHAQAHIGSGSGGGEASGGAPESSSGSGTQGSGGGTTTPSPSSGGGNSETGGGRPSQGAEHPAPATPAPAHEAPAAPAHEAPAAPAEPSSPSPSGGSGSPTGGVAPSG